MGLTDKQRGRLSRPVNVTNLFQIDGVTVDATATELNKVADVTPGTLANSKAVVVSSLGKINTFDTTVFKIGGVTVDATATELNSLDLSVAKGVRKIKKFESVSVSSSYAADAVPLSSWIFPAICRIEDAFVKVIAASTAAVTLDVGTLSSIGDEDGFLSGISVASTGIKNGTLISSATTRGALLCVDNSTAAKIPQADFTSGGKAPTIMIATGSTVAGSFVGDIYFIYDEFV